MTRSATDHRPVGGLVRSPSTVLIVDDSAFVRRLLTEVVDAERDFSVVGEAENGAIALEQVRLLDPDCVLMDLEMPVLDGFETVERLRREHPALVIVAFANVEGERRKVEARLGSFDVDLVAKPTNVGDFRSARAQVRSRLLAPLRMAVDESRPKGRPTTGPVRSEPIALKRRLEAVAIAASTGGPTALEELLSGLDEVSDLPILIVQHISAAFSGRLAARLNKMASISVVEAQDRQRVEPGVAYLSPGGVHMFVERIGGEVRLGLNKDEPVNSCRPSADVLFASMARVYGRSVLGVVLTGIGADGLEGCRVLAAGGAPIMVQDEDSSVAWGMPGSVANAGLASEQMGLSALPHRIQALVDFQGHENRRRPV